MGNSVSIKEKSSELGFSFCGIAKSAPLDEFREYYESFIRERLHQSFSYLETNLEKRLDPSGILPNVRSVITVLQNYYPPELILEEDNYIISKYAYGRDYHSIMKKTRKLADFIVSSFTGDDSKEKVKALPFVDSGTVLEKVWAQKCGVGWQGKNTLLINKNQGSFFFIGIILTNVEFMPDHPEVNRCGSCDKCQKACPTGALDNAYQLNISKCIAYRTIESKEAIPEEFKGKFKNRIYGCDICQDVCPYNRFALPSNEPDFKASERLMAIRKNDWLNLTEEQFSELLKDSAIFRTGYQKLMENIRFVSEE